jgi:hypothetical protein
MDERRAKIPCSCCNRKWSKGHKCQETKLFTLENNDKEEIETYAQMGEEELVN